MYWMGELPHFPVISDDDCQIPLSGHVNETERDQNIIPDVSLKQSSVWADSLMHY